MKKIFDEEELLKYKGRDAPVYVACNGKVYDVSESFLWRGGKHQGGHAAGEDLSCDILRAPHPVEFLDRFPVVGLFVRSHD